MLTERPQPRFRIWDVVEIHDYPQDKKYLIVGIQWNEKGDFFNYELKGNERVEHSFSRVEHPSWKLISRLGVVNPPTEPQTRVETLEETVARLRQEYEQCDDKGWLGKQIAWEKAEAERQKAHAPGALLPRLQAIEDRLNKIELQTARYGLVGPSPKNLFNEWIRPVNVGTEPAPYNQDG